MKQCMDIPKIQTRLRKVEGQVKGITNMVEKDVPCEDILIQISAAKMALHKIGHLILEGHLSHCVTDAIQKGETEEAIKNLSKTLERFARLG